MQMADRAAPDALMADRASLPTSSATPAAHTTPDEWLALGLTDASPLAYYNLGRSLHSSPSTSHQDVAIHG